MRTFLLFCLLPTFLYSCQKNDHENLHGSKVDIYMLQSYTETMKLVGGVATPYITNEVLADTPLVRDQDIESYTRSTTTFQLNKDIRSIIENYSSDKVFAVTVDKEPVYYGKFHPLLLSSISYGIATIDPILYSIHPNYGLTIGFNTIAGNSALQQLDKRNDSRITNALSASGKLR